MAGRKAKPVDPEIVYNLAKLGCTYDEIGAVVDRSGSLIEKRFRKLVQKGHEVARGSLRKLQWESCRRGNVAMQIWMGKQWLGQVEKPEPQKKEEEKPTKIEVIWRVASAKDGKEYDYDAPPVGATPAVPSEGDL